MNKNGGDFLEDYRNELFKIDDVLSYIQDIEDNNPSKILSDYVTDTEKKEGEDEYSLKSVDLEVLSDRRITTLDSGVKPDMATFLLDSVAILEQEFEKDSNINEATKEKIIGLLNDMRKPVIEKIEQKTEQQKTIEEEIAKFLTANEFFDDTSKARMDLMIKKLNNPKLWGENIEKLSKEEIESLVKEKLEKQYKLCNDEIGTINIVDNEKMSINDIIKTNPRLLYDENFVNRVVLWKENRKNISKDLIEGKNPELNEFIDVIIVLAKNGIKFNKQRMTKKIIGDKENEKGLLYKNANADKIIEKLEIILGKDNYKDYPISQKISDVRSDDNKQAIIIEAIDHLIKGNNFDALFNTNYKNSQIKINNLIDFLFYLKEVGVDFEKIKQKQTVDTLIEKEDDKTKVKEKIKELTDVDNSSLLNIGNTLYYWKKKHYSKYLETLYNKLKEAKSNNQENPLTKKDIEVLKRGVNPNSPWVYTIYDKAKQETELKSYSDSNVKDTKGVNETIKTLAIKTEWLKNKIKNDDSFSQDFIDKGDREIEQRVESTIQIAMFLADYFGINKIKTETGKELQIQDEKCLIYFLMDQDYPNIKIFSDKVNLARELNSETQNAEKIFDILLDQLRNGKMVEVKNGKKKEKKLINMITGKEMTEEDKEKNKEKDIIQLLREYYSEVIHKKIVDSRDMER